MANKCYSCKDPADIKVSWGRYSECYCEGCADDVIPQVENDGYTVKVESLERGG